MLRRLLCRAVDGGVRRRSIGNGPLAPLEYVPGPGRG